METRPAVLLVHDGELSGLARVVAGLEVELHERVGTPTQGECAWTWDLVVGTPRRLIELDEGPGEAGQRIAVLAAESRTARSLVARAGIRLAVRLPVHPAALRLLVLHSLYHGPDRRRTRRACIGSTVRLRSGLRRRTAILVDLSRRGCRILTTDALPAERRLSVAIPAEVAGGRPLSLVGVVARVAEADPRMPGVESMVVLFEGTSARDLGRLDEIVAAHGGGPAVCHPGAGVPLADPADWPAARPGNPALAEEPPLEADDLDEERRTGPSPEFPGPVIALGGAAARVLIGRHLSAEGMRVDPHPGLGVGDEVQLALHLGLGAEPLAVRARVERDDGRDGLVLVFHDLDAEARSEVQRVLALPTVVEMPDSGEETQGLVISEILGHASPAA